MWSDVGVAARDRLGLGRSIQHPRCLLELSYGVELASALVTG